MGVSTAAFSSHQPIPKGGDREIIADDRPARELLAAERRRIERALARLCHQDTGEEADEEDPINLAADLYQEEFDEGLADDMP